jgi:hypothetical protein
MAPVILATDKTQLTQFSGNKSAYPVYLTLGNLPRSIRRKPSEHACVLIAYLSVDKIRRDNMSQVEQRGRMQRLFHESMRILLEPLKDAGNNGVEMLCADGYVRKIFPILSSYVADYPEQCLVSCSKYGTCPKCQCPANDLQSPDKYPNRTQLWTENVIKNAKANARRPSDFYNDCMAQDVSGGVYVPFWSGFPHTDIHRIITPDVLHQLYQGVFKHIVNWCKQAMSPEELDRRIRALPQMHGVRHFKNGISALSQISGTERKNMAKILLACVADGIPARGVRAVNALLDFIYLAQYKTHDDITLGYMQDALDRFHADRDYFIQVEIREDFNIPKFHSLIHYIESIKAFGTTDNYNTEMFERLHIDFAKHGWAASNRRDEFPQMTTWLSRQEKISLYETYLSWTDSLKNVATPSPSVTTPSLSQMPSMTIAKHPTFPSRKIENIERSHNAIGFSHHLKLLFNSYLPQDARTSNTSAVLYDLPIDSVDVFSQFKFQSCSQDDDGELSASEIVKANPKDGRFDTVVVLTAADAESTALQGKFKLRNKLSYNEFH